MGGAERLGSGRPWRPVAPPLVTFGVGLGVTWCYPPLCPLLCPPVRPPLRPHPFDHSFAHPCTRPPLPLVHCVEAYVHAWTPSSCGFCLFVVRAEGGDGAHPPARPPVCQPTARPPDRPRRGASHAQFHRPFCGHRRAAPRRAARPPAGAATQQGKTGARACGFPPGGKRRAPGRRAGTREGGWRARKQSGGVAPAPTVQTQRAPPR